MSSLRPDPINPAELERFWDAALSGLKELAEAESSQRNPAIDKVDGYEPTSNTRRHDMTGHLAAAQSTARGIELGAGTKALKILLRVWGVGSIAIFGTIFTGYAIQSPAFDHGGSLHWLVWDGLPGHVALMLSGIYLVWAVYVIVASRNPQAWGSFFNFTMVANFVHGLIMVPGAFEPEYHSKFFTDIPWVWALAAILFFLRPAYRGLWLAR